MGSVALTDEILRYWLAVLRQEEALAARPRARKLQGAPLQAVVDLRKPAAGQQYAKLSTQGAEALLVDAAGQVERPLEADWAAFFEDWLLGRYRRGDEEEQAPELVLFPAVHLPRGELAGVLRLPVELTWWCADRPFDVPSMAKRRRGEYPEPPTHARLEAAERPSDESLPFFLDAHLLREVLRVDSARTDALFASLRKRRTLRAREMLWAVARTVRAQVVLERDAEPEANPNAETRAAEIEPDALTFPQTLPGPRPLLDELTGAVAERLGQLGHRARVYDVALVTSGARPKTTWHLQRDIKAARELLEAKELSPRSPLGLYLGNDRAQARRELCKGRFGASGLTPGQRDVCERALGSTLTAAQGPPGTGKTNLILNLFSHAVVDAVHAYVHTGRMGRKLAMVTSTNNRAVDNAIDPLSSELPDDALPVTLRVGSRQTVERVTVPQLERCLRWLSAQRVSAEQAQQRLEQASEEFRRRWRALEPKWAPHAQRLKKRERIFELHRKLGELRQAEAVPDAANLQRAAQRLAFGAQPGNGDANALARMARFVDSVREDNRSSEPLSALMDRLNALSRLTERSDAGARVAVRRHWKRTQKRHLPRAEQLLGFTLAHDLPPIPLGKPDAGAQEELEHWEEAAEDLLGRLSDVRDAWDRLHTQRARTRQREGIERELEQLETESQHEPPEDDADQELQQHELFRAALRVREAWAVVERDRLREALTHAIEVARDTRSLKRLWETGGGARKHGSLRQLFPAWGCTLLSLGNTLPSEQKCVDWMVIDEAGQCHPAHAVSALLRAKRALVVGDVHQLEPVVGLGPGDEQRLLDGLRLRIPAPQLQPYRVHTESLASIQTLADRAVHERATLTDHFRCQPEIVAICEALCGYGLRVHTPPRSRSDRVPWLRAPVLCLDVVGTQRRFSGSWYNAEEVTATQRLVRELLDAGIDPAELGIVTPYRGQQEQLWRALREAGVPLQRAPSEGDGAQGNLFGHAAHSGVALGTVHRFQGGECSIILFTTTLTQDGSLPFVDARVNLVNVAASRAKDHLVVIGHAPTLRAGRHTRHLLTQAAALAAP